MDGQPTRAGRSLVPAEWRRLGTYLRHPVLPPRATVSISGTARAIAPLLALDVALMALVLGGIGLAVSLGVRLPEHLLAGMTLTPGLIALFVIAAPMIEEAVFRGWVSGRPGHIFGTIAFVPALGCYLASLPPALGPASVLALRLAAAGFAALALLLLFLFRRRDALRWYARHFGWFYYASAVLFAAVHLTNFAAAGSAAMYLAPLVLPQFVLGLLLAYLRVNRGLWSSMSLHMLHNAVFVGLMLAGAN